MESSFVGVKWYDRTYGIIQCGTSTKMFIRADHSNYYNFSDIVTFSYLSLVVVVVAIGE
jgi:hypothetical protein